MLTLHHLEYSRSQRVLWLLEELDVPYELVRYPRTAKFRAPPELGKVHPLGKSPVLVDGDLMLAESSVILRYLNDRYGEGRFAPHAGTPEYWQHDEWLEFVESSAVLPVMVGVLGQMTGEGGPGLESFCDSEAGKMLAYLADALSDRPFLMGGEVMLADIQMTYFLDMASTAGLLDSFPVLQAYLERLMKQPGFQRAEKKGGPMKAPARKD
ncbi:glutathione S-transferase [Sphingomonas sp. SORGH_AS802]|uniref:glutathione S-transferase family protein n=1 Tax=unclassified Sphingomonas TaxID=196159 RepID=UPI00285870A8|nr:MULTISPECIES: glutathione S-transferase family protein [unclassified Sphingomonas]MDR6126698.1 glutathione S-transferase [Sphingomonas sp. SORGH_AS_0438]MDR6134937.1 glutathione S-transferase [Sphingomonas sp. SORGH_AS_0802]